MKDLTGNLKKLLSQKEIKDCVETMGGKISAQYSNSNPIFIGVLNGSFIFMADLLRSVTIDCEVDFIKIRSYLGKESSGTIELLKDISSDIKGRDVIIVEDIIDTGNTIKYLKKHLKRKNPKSIRIASLLMKPDSSELSSKIDWIGFEISSELVVGYGLDYNQEFRNLNAIFKLGEAI